MTTWYWPAAFRMEMTPSVWLSFSVWASPSSLSLKRRRVMQWVTEVTFSSPPTSSTIVAASFV